MKPDGLSFFWYRNESFTFSDASLEINELIGAVAKEFLYPKPVTENFFSIIHSESPSLYQRASNLYAKLAQKYLNEKTGRAVFTPFKAVEKLYEVLGSKYPIVSGIKSSEEEGVSAVRAIVRCHDKVIRETKGDKELAQALLYVPDGKAIKHLRKGTFKGELFKNDKFVPTLLFYVPKDGPLDFVPDWEENNIFPIPVHPIQAALDDNYLVEQVRKAFKVRNLDL